MLSKLKEKIKQNPRWKQRLLYLLVHPVKTRPRRWLRSFQFIYLQKGKGAIIYRNVRKDLVPFNRFCLGQKSVVESFSALNNMVGDITIGNHTRIGLGNTVIGPVDIGDHTNIAQNVTISGLNHNFHEVTKTIAEQGVSTSPIRIGDDVWIGANAVILAGVEIGKHSVIAAGSIVTRSVPPYSICAGNPAKVIKQYDFEQQEWVKVPHA